MLLMVKIFLHHPALLRMKDKIDEQNVAKLL
jgi:hypothetical protein